MSSGCWALVFIALSFPLSRQTGTNDSTQIVAFSMLDDEQPAVCDQSIRDEAVLSTRMVGIGEGGRQLIFKCARGILKRDTVLRKVRRSFVGIPFKIHAVDANVRTVVCLFASGATLKGPANTRLWTASLGR